MKNYLNHSDQKKNQDDVLSFKDSSRVVEKQKKTYWFQSLSFKFYGGLVLFVGFILLLSIFSWRSLLEIVNIQKILVTKNIPELALATTIVQQSEHLIQFAPQLMTSASQKEIDQIQEEIKQRNSQLKGLLDDFEKSSISKNSLTMRNLIHQMTQNLTAIENSVSQRRKLMIQMQSVSDQITHLSRVIHKILVIEIDNQTFNLALKSKTIQSNQVKNVGDIKLKDILLYRQLLNLQSQTNRAANLLREVVNLSHSDFLQPTKERFLAAILSCEKALEMFAKPYKELKTNIASLRQAGLSLQTGVFALKKDILDIEKTQHQYLVQNKKIANQFSHSLNSIHSNIQTGSQQINRLFDQSLKRNQTLFFIINALSLIGALALAFFFIGPLVRRLTYLSSKMRNMSKGSLQEEIQVQGSDEVRDMADALEVFRRHALEVQRLNLVEKLAEEVKEKNKTLEETIKDLHKTRDQLVVQEKLASLGQLTSGIAHEIKNPLNFINNFSKISKDLAEELKEELEKTQKDFSVNPEEWNLIQELLNDIQSNMEKISSHGTRANDIIIGMLQHSRGQSGKEELVDIHKYMDTYSNLAFHSKRSLNSSFNVSFKKEYDPHLKPIMAVPQDISRIILNLITNACDTVEEKRKKEKNFEGCIVLKTKKEDDKAKMMVRDNGMGMPLSVKEKIFNPFFTTKETGQGTGLGLSLVHDIVTTKYDGKIEADSKEGEFTELTVTLPVKKKTQ